MQRCGLRPTVDCQQPKGVLPFRRSETLAGGLAGAPGRWASTAVRRHAGTGTATRKNHGVTCYRICNPHSASLQSAPGHSPSRPAEAAGTWDEIPPSQGELRAAFSQCRMAGSEAHTLLRPACSSLTSSLASGIAFDSDPSPIAGKLFARHSVDLRVLEEAIAAISRPRLPIRGRLRFGGVFASMVYVTSSPRRG